MDLIGDEPVLKMSNSEFKIYSRNFARPPQVIGKNSAITNSLVSEGCVINGTVINSVLSGGVIIDEGAVVKDSIIMDDVHISRGAQVYSAIIDSDAVVGPDACVGVKDADKDNITVIAKGSVIAINNTKKKEEA